MNLKDFALGGVAGAALAVAANLYFGNPAAPEPVGPPDAAPAGSAVHRPMPPPIAGSASAPVMAGAPAGRGPGFPPGGGTADPRGPAGFGGPGNPGGPGGPRGARVEAPAITLSTEHAKLLALEARPMSMPERHARFAEEALDPGWSQQAEMQLRQGLQEAGVQNGFELLAVECRQTMCELRLFGSGPQASERWSAIATQLGKQYWWSQNFSGVSTATSDMNGRAVIATILQRAKR